MTLLDCTSCVVATIPVFRLQGNDEGDPAFRSQLQSMELGVWFWFVQRDWVYGDWRK
jgi:hypothetical protein